MKIGVDCRPLIQEKTGIGFYLWEILSCWGKMGISSELWLYAPRDFSIPPELLHSSVTVHRRVVQVRPSELWMHTVLPLQLIHDKVDVFWGPNYSMPVISPGVPSVLTVHDTVYREFPETLKWVTWLHNRVGLERYVKICEKIIVPSKNTQEDLVRHLAIPREKIVVTPLGVSERFNIPRDATDIVNSLGLHEVDYFLAVGTLEPRKNLKTVIDAFLKFHFFQPDAHLVIVGAKGWGNVENQLSSLSSPNIHVLGYVSNGALAALYSRAKALLYLPLYEGFGLPPLEAMKAKTPVLVSNTSSLPEVVADCGLYTNPRDVYGIVDQMNRLWSDEILRQQLISKGLKRANMMSWDNTAQYTHSVLDEVGRADQS